MLECATDDPRCICRGLPCCPRAIEHLLAGWTIRKPGWFGVLVAFVGPILALVAWSTIAGTSSGNAGIGLMVLLVGTIVGLPIAFAVAGIFALVALRLVAIRPRTLVEAGGLAILCGAIALSVSYLVLSRPSNLLLYLPDLLGIVASGGALGLAALAALCVIAIPTEIVRAVPAREVVTPIGGRGR